MAGTWRNSDNPLKPFTASFKEYDSEVERTQIDCETEAQALALLERDCSWLDSNGRGATVAQLWYHLMRRYRTECYMSSTLADMEGARKVIVPILGQRIAADVEPDDIVKLFHQLRRTYEFGSAKKNVRRLLVVYRDTIAAGWLQSEPVTEALKLFKGGTDSQARKAEDISDAIVDALLGVADAQTRLIVLLMADAGLVAAEIAALARGAFTTSATPSVTVSLVLDKGILRRHTKDSVARIVPMTPRLAAAVLDYERNYLNIFLLPSDLMFQRNDGSPWDEGNIRYCLQAAGKRAGVKATAQDLRFHAAAKWINQGISIVGLAARLGLKDPLRVATTFELLFRRRTRPRQMGLVSYFLLGFENEATRSMSPQFAAALTPLPAGSSARIPYRAYRSGRSATDQGSLPAAE